MNTSYPNSRRGGRTAARSLRKEWQNSFRSSLHRGTIGTALSAISNPAKVKKLEQMLCHNIYVVIADSLLDYLVHFENDLLIEVQQLVQKCSDGKAPDALPPMLAYVLDILQKLLFLNHATDLFEQLFNSVRILLRRIDHIVFRTPFSIAHDVCWCRTIVRNLASPFENVRSSAARCMYELFFLNFTQVGSLTRVRIPIVYAINDIITITLSPFLEPESPLYARMGLPPGYKPSLSVLHVTLFQLSRASLPSQTFAAHFLGLLDDLCFLVARTSLIVAQRSPDGKDTDLEELSDLMFEMAECYRRLGYPSLQADTLVSLGQIYLKHNLHTEAGLAELTAATIILNSLSNSGSLTNVMRLNFLSFLFTFISL